MARPVQVVPAILTDDPKTLEAMVRQAESFTSYVQLDIMDGLFVPSRSINYEHLISVPMKISWEAHLMVKSPEDYLAGLHQAGAKRVIFHYEATTSPAEVIARARQLGLEAGLAVNPETPVSAITPLASNVDSVLFLTVHPGFYGSEFIPEVLDKITEFRNTNPNIEIGVDGGIKETNIAEVARSGVDVINVGSAIFLKPRPDESYRQLVKLAREDR